MMEKKSYEENQQHDHDDHHQPSPMMESSLSESTIRTYADPSIQYPAKTMTRSSTMTRTYSMMGEEEKTIAGGDAFYSYFSTPSRISRSSTHQHLFTPEYNHEYPLPTEKNRNLSRFIPSRRGVCNIFTMFAIVALVIFLFAGYPLFTYIKINYY
ncbi:unnamed protein product [Cunninghamella blakesleeana]